MTPSGITIDVENCQVRGRAVSGSTTSPLTGMMSGPGVSSGTHCGSTTFGSGPMRIEEGATAVFQQAAAGSFSQSISGAGT